MVATPTKPLTLNEFLALPDTEPASEFLDGKIIQNPMLKRKHLIIQGELCTAINQVAKPMKIAYAFPELRCTFGDRSLVPDLIVLELSTGQKRELFNSPVWVRARMLLYFPLFVTCQVVFTIYTAL